MNRTAEEPTATSARDAKGRSRRGKLVARFGTLPGALALDEAHAGPALRGLAWSEIDRRLAEGEDLTIGVEAHELESLADLVERLTGAVSELVVPDALLDRADQMIVVDRSPEEVLAKVGTEALAPLDSRLFERGVLVALRELGLRRAAERVDADVRAYRRGHNIDEAWPLTERVLVCVSSSPMSQALVRAASRLARETRAEWHAVYIETPLELNLSAVDRERAALHLALAESLGAITATRSGERASEALLDYARQNDVTKIVVGKPDHTLVRDLLFGSFLDEVVRGSGDIDVYAIRGERAALELEPTPRRRPLGASYAKGALVIAAATVGALVVARNAEPSNLIMVYLAAVVLVASRWGLGPSVVASTLAVAAFDFFFVPPLYTLAVQDLRYLVTFAVMFAVAVLTSTLTERVRRQAQMSRAREERTAALYAMSRELASAVLADRIAEVAARHVRKLVGGDARVHVGAAPKSMKRGARVIPLVGARGEVGVLELAPERAGELADPMMRAQIEVFASQAAVAIERALLADEANRATLEADQERLQSSLLSSVSHDLRTPLAVIQGVATTLLDTEVSAGTQRELLVSVRDEAERLNRLVTNLLDMTRLESGVLKPKKELNSIEEIVGSALTRLDARLHGRVVETDVPEDLPLVPMDPVLVEQVVYNLVDNALKYTPNVGPIEIAARATDVEVEVLVRDRGPGIPRDERGLVFRRFHGSGQGAGLGLAICKGMIEAHGGTIALVPREGGGTIARFTLPLASGSELAGDEEPARSDADVNLG